LLLRILSITHVRPRRARLRFGVADLSPDAAARLYRIGAVLNLTLLSQMSVAKIDQ